MYIFARATMENNTDTPKEKLYSLYWWKWLVFALAAFGLHYQLFQNKNLWSAWSQYKNNVSPDAKLLTIIVFILMFINWSVEAIRWNSLLRKVEYVSFIDALKATFSGITFALFTPNRVGEYAGRVLFINTVSRWRILIVTTIGIYAQLLSTIFRHLGFSLCNACERGFKLNILCGVDGDNFANHIGDSFIHSLFQYQFNRKFIRTIFVFE